MRTRGERASERDDEWQNVKEKNGPCEKETGDRMVKR